MKGAEAAMEVLRKERRDFIWRKGFMIPIIYEAREKMSKQIDCVMRGRSLEKPLHQPIQFAQLILAQPVLDWTPSIHPAGRKRLDFLP